MVGVVESFGPQHHPNDSPRDGTLHELAIEQLKKWQDIAQQWDTFEAPINGRQGIHCRRCSQTIWFRTDMGGHVFLYTSDQILALVVAHIRQNHAEVNSGDQQKAG
jgi:hypothetical protein